VEGVEGVSAYRAVNPATGARIICIGDIHGCYDELTALLARVAPTERDVVVSVGDVVTKGPDPARCLDLWRERGYLAVQGNNELKVLANARPVLRLLARDPVLRRGDLLRYLESWPRVIDFPREQITVVHGGFLPGTRITAQSVEGEGDVITELRWIRKKDGEWRPIPKDRKKKGDVLWAEKWDGDRFILYGHTPLQEPRFDRSALGLDTGCVYGGRLTAAIYDGEWRIESVAAKRRYAS
jgi:predicted phosphodiesterase